MRIDFCVAMLIVTQAVLVAAPPQEESPKTDPTVFRNSLNPELDMIGDPLPANALMRFGTHRFQHPSSATDMVLANDDQVVVTLSSNLFIGWDAVTGKELWRKSWRQFGDHIVGSAYGQRFLTFGKTSGKLYSIGRNDEFYEWDARTGIPKKRELTRPVNPFQLLQPRRAGGTTFTSIDLSHDEARVLMGGGTGLYMFEAESGKQVWAKVNGPKQPIDFQDMNRDRLTSGGDYSIGQFSPDNVLIAALQSQAPNSIVLRKAKDGKSVRTVKAESRIVRFCFSPDGASIFTTERDCGISKYSVESGEREWRLKLEPDPDGGESYASAVDCSANGQFIAAGAPIGSKYWIYLIDASTGKAKHILKSDMWKPWSVCFTSNDRTLFSTGWDGTIRRWDVASGRELPLEEGIRASGGITYAPNGEFLAVLDGEGDIRIVDAESGVEKQRVQLTVASGEALEFSADSQFLYIGGGKDEHVALQCWDLKQRAFRNSWQWDKAGQTHAGVEEIAVTKDGKYVAAVSFRQDKVRVWNVESGELQHELKHLSVYGLAIDPTSQYLLTVGWDKLLRIWSLKSGELVGQVNVEAQIGAGERRDLRMYTVTCSPNGKRLALAHLDGNVSVWTWVQKPKPELQYLVEPGRRFSFGALEYSPNGSWLALGDGSGFVRLLNACTGEMMQDVGQHADHIFTLSFGADRQTLATGGGGVSYLWSLDPNPRAQQLEFAELWELLRGPELEKPRDGELLPYDAMSVLAASPEKVEEVFQRLRMLTSVLDAAEITKGLEQAAAGKRMELLELAAEKNDAVELRQTVERALSVFTLASTSESLASLDWLAEQHVNPTLRELAAGVMEAVQLSD